ncbi:GNAT family N-acetyltransferase [Teredinibacter purpureus]|uniref:GNAT family N-acetyltransferase n=1 Tax=Teredinibacter purpureus TaxID=2731756 RepID=UPI0005F7D9D0|nr:GNAT family N-acetyltransferase [Teredinibacter purpureus]
MQATFINSITDINEHTWAALWPEAHPFTRYGFLAALETSGSTTAESGWQPCHLLIHNNQTLIAALPLYEKTHSYGEYVFDWGWADAYQRAGLEYYPKLLNAIPFTPATGPRMAFSSDLNTLQYSECMAVIEEAIAQRLCDLNGSGFHCLFPSASNRSLFSPTRYAQRQGTQFHWFNQGFTCFDQFLESFSSRKRKNIKRERQKVCAQNIQFAMRKGGDVSASDWRIFSMLYQTTYLKRSGHAGYLNEDFFCRIAKAMPESIVLCSAHGESLENPMLAAALYFRDDTTLYGRYWGAREEVDGLHFETCYYQGIDYAIAQGLQRFDPGAQGEHKIQRGFTPVKTCSYHYLVNKQFHQAVETFVGEELQQNHAYCTDARTYVPFKDGHTLMDDDMLLEVPKSPKAL